MHGLYGNHSFDKEKYVSILKELADLNDTKAIVRLGDIYLCNDFKTEARVSYEKAVNLKFPIAPYELDNLKAGGVPSTGCKN